MNTQEQNPSVIPAPVASVKTGGYKVGDEVTMYGRNMRVVGTRQDGTPILDLAPIQPRQQSTSTGTQQSSSKVTTPKQQDGKKHLGMWLSNRLRGLYADPSFDKASSDVQKYYKNKAYDKWVVPYYKHINIPVMSREAFVDGTQDPEVHKRIASEYLARKSSKEELTILKTSSKVLSSVSNLLSTFEKFNPFGTSETRQSNIKALKTSEDYYDKQAQDLEDRIQDKGGHDLETHITQLGTQMIFFEASGGSGAANMLRVTNPAFVKAITPTIKTLWNGAVTGTLWGATTGSKVKDLPDDAATFALFDLGLSAGSAGFMKVFHKLVDSKTIAQVVEESAQDLVSGKGVVRPKVEEIVKGGDAVNKQAAKAATAKALNESAQKIAGGDTNGAFKKLGTKQQKALLTRLTMAGSVSGKFELEDQAKEIMLKEDESKIQQVVPAASKIQAEIDQVIAKNGTDPVKAKLGATLPRHQTTIDSPLSHISARMSFLRNQLKAAESNDLIMSEVDSIREALQQEQTLYKQVKNKVNPSYRIGTGVSLENAPDVKRHALINSEGKEIGHIQISVSQDGIADVGWFGPNDRKMGKPLDIGTNEMLRLKNQLKEIYPNIKTIKGKATKARELRREERRKKEIE